MEKVAIFSSSPKGKVKIPCSKSDAHRKIIAASLCFNQRSVISNVDISNDIRMTIEAMRAFAVIKEEGNKLIIEGKKPHESKGFFDAGESGSTLRFLIPLFSYFFQSTEIKGSKRLLQRPLSIYEEIYKEGLKVDKVVRVNKTLKEGDFNIKGDVSSQFISGLLFVLPLLSKDSYIHIIGNYESKSYVKMTIDTLKIFNIVIEEIDEKTLYIRGGQKYKANDVEIEGDYSQASFFACLGAINGEIEVEGLNENSLQGDKKIIEYLSRLNADIQKTEKGYIFKKGKLKGTTIDLNDTPDLGPILMAIAPFCEGTTKFINTRRLKLKESDRIQAMKEELLKFNILLEEYENEVIIKNQEASNSKEIINPHNDHRILMAISILSTLFNKTIIEDVKCVNKSYPNFFKDLLSVGVKGEIYDD